MLKGLKREITLAVQSRTGATAALFIWAPVGAVAAFTAFTFICVAGYHWFARQFGDVFAALLMTGIFVVIALIAVLMCAVSRRRARERAILERAARARGSSWLLDPKIFSTALQVGRSIGWQRLAPVALLGFMAAQWAREYRQRDRGPAE